MLQAALAAGVSAAGGEALLGGVLPTPAAPLLLNRYGFDLGDRALRLTQSLSGQRRQVLCRRRLQALRRGRARDRTATGELRHPRHRGTGTGAPGIVVRHRGAASEALGLRSGACASCEALTRTTCESSRPALPICASMGWTCCSTAPTAPPTRSPQRYSGVLAPRSRSLAATPDGRNINDGCGSTHIAALGERVRAGGHALGLAFDGDGDRVLAVDRTGEVVDGDELIALAALHLRERETLGR